MRERDLFIYSRTGMLTPSEERNLVYWKRVILLERVLVWARDRLSKRTVDLVRERVEAERSKLDDGFEPMADDLRALTVFCNSVLREVYGDKVEDGYLESHGITRWIG